MKWGFLVVALAGVTAVYLVQRKPVLFKKWETNAALTMMKGKAEGRPVLILFHSPVLEEDTRHLEDEDKGVLEKSQSREIYERLGYLRVHEEMSLGTEKATAWKITRLPTMIVIDREGKEAGRREGYVGLAEFWAFIDLDKRSSASAPASGPSRP